MDRTLITAPSLPDTSDGGFSHAVRVGNLLFLSGQSGAHQDHSQPSGDFETQTRRAFAKMQAVSEAAGGSLANLVTMTVFITDRSYSAEFRRLRVEILQRDFPASALIGVSALGRPDVLLEIQATAVLD